MTMTKHEYKILGAPDLAGVSWASSNTWRSVAEDLNALGAEGWELVAAHDGVLYFKRTVKHVAHTGPR